MKTAIITCKPDKAGMNIRECLISDFDFKEIEESFDGNKIYQNKKNPNIKLYTSNEYSVFCENIDKKISADLFIFATTHKSVSGIPSLCAHAPGNWDKAEHGGKDRQLCIAPALYIRKAFLLLNKNNLEGFEAVMECTHHGPYIEKPVMFIEIGSTEKEWENKAAGKAIAKTIVELLENEPQKTKIAIGIGGLHTCPIFGKIMQRKDIAIGHVCPKYMLEKLDKELIQQAMEKSNAELALLDWKGMSKEKDRIISLLEELKIKTEKIKLN